jgi:hypothetical protein
VEFQRINSVFFRVFFVERGGGEVGSSIPVVFPVYHHLPTHSYECHMSARRRTRSCVEARLNGESVIICLLYTYLCPTYITTHAVLLLIPMAAYYGSNFMISMLS